MVLEIGEITRLYATRGSVPVRGAGLCQLHHALQCADLAERARSPAALVAAALLHDLGHLLASYSEELSDQVDDGHQYVPVPFLRGLLPDAVIEPIRLHVDAKRYLCAVDGGYWSSLSTTSRRRLAAQGGPFSAAEAAAFMRQPFAADALAVRRWDGLARDPAARPPGWSHFRPLLERLRDRERMATMSCGLRHDDVTNTPYKPGRSPTILARHINLKSQHHHGQEL